LCRKEQQPLQYDPFPPRLEALGFALEHAGENEYLVPPLCALAAGSFLMGSDPARDQEAKETECPQHPVTLSAYAIARYPVTVAEYAGAVRAGAVREPPVGTLFPIGWSAQLRRPDHPVVCVSWGDALAYAAWLARLTAHPWRLATEAEWERAARGTDGRIYPWGDTWEATRANTRDGGPQQTTPVGSYTGGVGPSGTSDQAGNVWEWTSSLFLPYPYVKSDGRELHEPEGFRGWRVLRGGSWNYPAQGARAARRGNADPSFVRGSVGFRLVLTEG
jgi:formylglycine-generating enzyme required for sulfatase activity